MSGMMTMADLAPTIKFIPGQRVVTNRRYEYLDRAGYTGTVTHFSGRTGIVYVRFDDAGAGVVFPGSEDLGTMLHWYQLDPVPPDTKEGIDDGR